MMEHSLSHGLRRASSLKEGAEVVLILTFFLKLTALPTQGSRRLI